MSGQATPARTLVGLMSGTSADGVDAAAVRITGRGLSMSATLLAHQHVAYDADLRRRIFALRTAGGGAFAEVAEVCRLLTDAHADAARAAMSAADVKPNDVAALAAHGQTLHHAPPDSIQLFDPARLAWATGCRVVGDFRRADLAAGGQGAPLVPFADWLLFRSAAETRVLLNLGGIANLTYLPAGGTIDDVIAFDTGPANCLSDHVMRRSGHGSYDPDGRLAVAGEPAWDVANAFIDSYAFFTQRPPKSLDVPELIEAYEREVRPKLAVNSVQNELATCAAIAGLSIGYACVSYLPNSEHDIDEIIVTGGGVHNAAVMTALRDFPAFPGITIRGLAEGGVSNAAKEAVAFALLAAATLDGEPSNVPSATGASRRVVLGSVTPAP